MNELARIYKNSNLKKVWDVNYKSMVINDVIFNGLYVPYEISDCIDKHYEICLFSIDNVLIWLSSKEGIEFLNESFNLKISTYDTISSLNKESVLDIDISENKDIRAYRGFRKESKLVKSWNNKYKKMFYSFFNPLIMDYIKSSENNKEETLKELYEPIIIVVDTLICWINSPVGRCFVRDVYKVDISDGIDGMPLDMYQMGLISKEYLLKYGLSEEEIMKLPQP